MELVINTDASPFCPDGWTVEEHQRNVRKFEWDPTNVCLYLDPGQNGATRFEGHDLRKKLKDQPVLNACVLDWLLAHPEFIPKDWKGKAIFFWGTIYNSKGHLYVRFLYLYDEKWTWGYGWLDLDWRGDRLAAMLAS